MIDKKNTLQEKNSTTPLTFISVIAVVVLLTLSPLLTGATYAQYGGGIYGDADFSGQQTDPSDPSDPGDGPAAPSDDSESADDSTDAGATDDELVETGQALSPLSIAALSLVVVATLSIFFVRPKNKQKE